MIKKQLIALLSVLIAAPAIAQSPSDSSRADTAQTLQPVQIKAAKTKSRYDAGASRSATRIPALLRDLPQSVTAVTSALVRDQRMKSVADIARYLPGITMGQGEGNRDQPTIRGNSTTADFFVDGVRDDAQYFRDTYNLERLEALKGSNAMTFGRGGGGGVLNRVTKESNGITKREIAAEAGSFGGRRLTSDFQQKLSTIASVRLNSVYESSRTFRNEVTIDRTGINPTIALSNPARTTTLAAGYEYFYDRRTADRGIPSLQGKPVNVAAQTFFGSQDESWARMQLNSINATLTHNANIAQLRNRTSFAKYDKFYQNVYPTGATSTEAMLSAYNHAIDRTNFFNQTEAYVSRLTGSIGHDLVGGVELGSQVTDNFRNTGYFGTATTARVPLENPLYTSPVTFTQSASDADNATRVLTRSAYILDQISFSPAVKVIAGVRYERFALRFNDHRTDQVRTRADDMISPRAGIVIKPTGLSSIYANYSVSYLPGSGDQFGSLTDVTRQLEPERFTNYEIGSKWDALDRLALTIAAYRLDRTNTRSADPSDPARIVQTGAQRSSGVELTATGSITSRWEIAAGAARQKASIISPTAASPAGATVPLVPSTSASLWNRFALTNRVGFGAGFVHQSKVYAAIDNKVVLPGFARFDGALFANAGRGIKAQLNVENIFNRRYFASSHGNNNITPGSPRGATLSLSAEF